MFLSVVLAYLPYCLVTAFTPGPNNIICLHAISQNGWKKGWKTVAGVLAGFFCVMVVCALFCYSLEDLIYKFERPLTYIGAAYIIYLAVHIAMSKPDDDETKKITFWKAFLLDFVNVKIILYAITVYTLYAIPKGASLAELLMHAVMLCVIGYSGTLTWAVFGGILQKFINAHYRGFNICMGVVLAYCAVRMII